MRPATETSTPHKGWKRREVYRCSTTYLLRRERNVTTVWGTLYVVDGCNVYAALSLGCGGCHEHSNHTTAATSAMTSALVPRQ